MRNSLLVAASAIVLSLTGASATGGGLEAKGHLIAGYAYVGSSSSATTASALRLTGSFRVSSASGRVALRYRSHHWFNFKHPRGHVLESAFENRNIIQTVALETHGLGARDLSTRLGRLFPDMDYASSPVIDGAAAAFKTGHLTVGGAAGRMVDLWDGKRAGSRLLVGGQLKLETERLRAAAGFQSASYPGITKREFPAGFSVTLAKSAWIEGYGAYDFESRSLARAGASLSWYADAGSLSLAASLWRNQFDQLYVARKGQDLPYWGLHSESVPSTYRDVRLSGSCGRNGWGVRGMLGVMAGVRAGWTAGGHLTAPSFFGLMAGVGTQVTKSDFIESYAFEGRVTYQVRHVTLEAQSQIRNYGWRGRASRLHSRDGCSEISVDYPLGRHFRLNASAAGVFRQAGSKGFRPQLELRLVAQA